METETTSNEDDIDFTVRSDIAQAEGWQYTQEPPAPETCQFCRKTLYYHGVTFPSFGTTSRSKRVIVWHDDPERCDCPEAAEYWRQYEERKKAEEEARRQQEQQARIQARVAKLLKDSGIKARFRVRTFDRFEQNSEGRRKAYQAAKRYADSFGMMLPATDKLGNVRPPQKERNGLFIAGGYGTGKTHLAAAIANELIKGGTAVICMTMIDLLARIKQTFDRAEDASEAEIMRLYEEVPLLIIDDIGSEQPTEWGISKIYAIINARYEAYMPTIITTNYTGEELIRRMTPTTPSGKLLDSRNAEKTIDRLKEMCAAVEMNWESWRPR